MDTAQLNGIANFIWNIADDVLRDVFVRGKYRDVILPMVGADHGIERPTRFGPRVCIAASANLSRSSSAL
jgi:hypothetical protein